MNDRSEVISTAQDLLKEREHHLKMREDEIASREEHLRHAEADLRKRQHQAAEIEQSIEARARDVAQREIEADAGFAAKNREALAALAEAHAALRSEVDHIQGELDAARLQGVEKLEKWLFEERRTRMAALDAELRSDRDRWT